MPEDGKNEHLKILQRLAISLMDDEIKEEIVNATDKKVIEELLNRNTEQ
ncbi:PTS sugar transporter subunit IIA [Clostridium estertheticum]|nr:PTS sugar transporter subunit IIA [Clostridium estertheticum]